jgi:hypothetical protein
MNFITKRHLPRRTFLRGAGVSIALPLLDSMVPAQTPLTRTAANPRSRLGCIYVPHGATMDKWTPAQSGTGFEFTEILKPLEKYRDRLIVVSNRSTSALRSTRLSPKNWDRTPRCLLLKYPSRRTGSTVVRATGAPTRTRFHGKRPRYRSRWSTIRRSSSKSCLAKAIPQKKDSRASSSHAACWIQSPARLHHLTRNCPLPIAPGWPITLTTYARSSDASRRPRTRRRKI